MRVDLSCRLHSLSSFFQSANIGYSLISSFKRGAFSARGNSCLILSAEISGRCCVNLFTEIKVIYEFAVNTNESLISLCLYLFPIARSTGCDVCRVGLAQVMEHVTKIDATLPRKFKPFVASFRQRIANNANNLSLVRSRSRLFLLLFFCLWNCKFRNVSNKYLCTFEKRARDILFSRDKFKVALIDKARSEQYMYIFTGQIYWSIEDLRMRAIASSAVGSIHSSARLSIIRLTHIQRRGTTVPRVDPRERSVHSPFGFTRQ